MNQPTWKPTAKMAASGQAGVIVFVVVAILAHFNVIVPEGTSDALLGAVVLIGQVVSWAVGYWKRERRPLYSDNTYGQ